MSKIYIYDQRKVGFYMFNGVFPLDSGTNSTTGKRFYVFTKEKTQEVYEKWIQESKKYAKGKNHYEKWKQKSNDTKQVPNQYKRR